MGKGDENVNTTLYVYLLALKNRDIPILKYLYEDMNNLIETDEFDVIRLLRMCIMLDYREGFMFFINSMQTARIYIHSSLDFKDEFISYVVSDEAIENPTINSKKFDALVREIKEKMVSFPYCSLSWIYIDPYKE